MGNIFANAKEFYMFTFISIIRFERKSLLEKIQPSQLTTEFTLVSFLLIHKNMFNITDTPLLSITCFKFKNDITWVINGEFFLWTVNFFVSLFFPILWKNLFAKLSGEEPT